MPTVNLPPQPTETDNATPPSWRTWGTTFVTTTWKRASRAYSYSKNAAYVVGRMTSKASSSAKGQITTLAKDLYPRELLVSTKDLAIRVTTEIYNTSTKTKVAAISLVALGYAYSQAPSFDDTMKRLIEQVIKDRPSSKPPKSPKCDSTYQITTSVLLSTLVSSLITRNYYLPAFNNEMTTRLQHLLGAQTMGLEGTLDSYHLLIKELQVGITTLSSQLPAARNIPLSPIPNRYRNAFTPDDSNLHPDNSDFHDVSLFLLS